MSTFHHHDGGDIKDFGRLSINKQLSIHPPVSSSSTSTSSSSSAIPFFVRHSNLHLNQPCPLPIDSNRSMTPTPAATPPSLINRVISPPTPAPSPQPNHSTHHNQCSLAFLASDSDPSLSLIDAFSSLSSFNRSKFLNDLLPHLKLNELTSLSAKILPRLKRDFLKDLPIEVSLHVLSFVDDPKTLIRASMVSKFWRSLINDESTWKEMCSKRGFNNSSIAHLSLDFSKHWSNRNNSSPRRNHKHRKSHSTTASHLPGFVQASLQPSSGRQPGHHRSHPSNLPSLVSPIPTSSSYTPIALPSTLTDPPDRLPDPFQSAYSFTFNQAQHYPESFGFFDNSPDLAAHSPAGSLLPLSTFDSTWSAKLGPSVSPVQSTSEPPHLDPQLAEIPSSSSFSRRTSFTQQSLSPRSRPLLGLTNQPHPEASSPSAEVSSSFQQPEGVKQRPKKVISSYSPQPGMVAPTNASLSRRTRPQSMPMRGLSLNMTRSVSAFPDLNQFPGQSSIPTTMEGEDAVKDHNLPLSDLPSDTTTSQFAFDLPSSASTVDGFDYSLPRSPFSYKTYFKRAYLTESNWLRGPGELMAMQTSQNNDGNEWVVTSIGFDDDWIVVGMATSKIHVFSALTGEFVRTLVGHELGVWCLSLVSKGGVRDPRDVRRDQKGKGPASGRTGSCTGMQSSEDDDDEEREALHENFGDLSSSENPFPEWVSSDLHQPPHPPPTARSVRMTRVKAGLGVTAVWPDDRSPSPHAHQNTTSEETSSYRPGSIFQPATTDDVPISGEWISARNSHTFPQDTSHVHREVSRGSISDRRLSTLSGVRHDAVRPTPRRPSSFSSYMSSSRSGPSVEDRYSATPSTATAGIGGMGLGAGGPSSGNLQQASACGIAGGWGQDRSIVVSGGCDRDVRVWDVSTGKCLFVLEGHSSTIRCLKVLDGRPIAVSGSRDSTLRVWDIELGIQKHVLTGHSLSVRAIEVHGNRAVSGSYDTTCRLWDVDTGECLRILRGHYHQIYAIAFDGYRIASGSMDSTVCIWSAETGELLGLLQGHTALVGQVQMMSSPQYTAPSSSQQQPSQNVLVTGGSDGRVVIFSLDSFECLLRLCAHDNSVTCLQFDQRFVVTGGNDGRVKLWDFKTGQFIRELSEPCEAVWRIVIRDDKAVLLCKREGKTVMELISFRPNEV